MSDEDDVYEHLNVFFDTISKLEEMGITNHDDLLTTLLLNSLPDSFDNFAGNIRSRDALPTPDICKIQIPEEFERRKSLAKRDEQAMVAAKKYYSKYNSGPKSSPSQYGQSNQKHLPFRCSKCGEMGHKASNCLSRQDEDQKDTQNQPKINHQDKAHVSEESYLAEIVESKEAFQAELKYGEADTSCASHCNEGPENAFRTETSSKKNRWCLDSGATSHLCRKEGMVNTWIPAEGAKLNLACNSSAAVRAKGTVRLPVTDGQNSRSVNFENTLFVPDLRVNLLSVAKITDKGLRVVFSRDEAIVSDDCGKKKLLADRIGDLILLKRAHRDSECG